MLKKLLEELAKKSSALATAHEKAFGDASTPEDVQEVIKLTGEIKDLDDKIEAFKASEAAIARNATTDRNDPNANRDPASAAAARVKDAPKDATEKLALACQSLYLAKREYGSTSARNILKSMEDLGYGKAADEFGQINKANTTLTGSSGGFLVAENFDRTFIDLLYAESSFMAGNPRRIPMPEGNYNQAGALTGATATYRGEGDDISTSNPTFREISMSAKLLSNIVPVTNQLLRYSLGEAGEFIRRDGSEAMSLKMDQAAYLGSGTGNVPQGIMNLPGINKVAAASATTATPTVQQIEADLKRLLGFLTRYPVLRAGAEWRISARTWLYLSTLRGSDDQLIYPQMDQAAPRLMNLPVRMAGQFPENLGVGTNETYIALISFSQVLVGEAKGLAVDLSSEASYRDSGGNLQSAFSTDSTLFRFTMEHDFDARYAESVNVLTGIKF